MTETLIREQEILREAVEVLWKHQGPARVVRLCHLANGRWRSSVTARSVV
jgi:hypothetical protein